MNSSAQIRTTRLLAFAAIAACWALPAAAQQYFDPGLFQSTIQKKPPGYQPPGARLGSFMLSPGVEAAWAHNDNVFYLPEDEIDDDVMHVRPWANLVSDWNRHAFNVSAAADIAEYRDFSQNDYEDWTLRADGRVDVTRDDYFSFDGHFMHLHEDRRSPDSRFGIEPTEFDYGGFGAGYDHVLNRLKLGLYYNHSFFDYEDTLAADGELIDNQDRNRDQDRLAVRANWQLGPETAIFASWGVNEINYEQPVDAEGYRRDSDGQAVSAGLSWDMTDLLTGDVSLSWSEQTYDDPLLLDVDGYSLGAGLTWTPWPTTVVNVRIAGSPQETTQPGTSGYFSRLYSARLQHELRPNLLLNARVSWTDNEYENPGIDAGELTRTDVTRWGIGASYLFNRNFYVSAGYTRESQDANIAAFGYDANRYFLTLGLEL